MLLTLDLHEDFVNVEGVAVASMLSLQSAGINGSELVTPEADRFATDGYAALGEKIFNISVAEIESIVEPDSTADDIRWESVAFVCIHYQIIPFPAFNLAVPGRDMVEKMGDDAYRTMHR